MTIKVLDRAFETTTTTGTGVITLAGAQQGFVSFATAGNGAKVLYQINDGDTTGLVQNWEIGIGTVTTGTPNTLTRSTVLKSSNNNSPVNFGSGVKNIIGSIAGLTLATRDENLNFVEGFGIGGGTANAHTVTVPVTPLGYSDGMEINYFATVANTGAMTINVNGLGVKSAKLSGADVPAGYIGVGSLVSGRYRTSSGFIELSGGATIGQGAKADSAIQPATGQILRRVVIEDATVAGAGTAMAISSAPSNTAGDLLITLNVPARTRAGSKMYLEMSMFCGNAVTGAAGVGAVVAFFLNSTATAFAMAVEYNSFTNGSGSVYLIKKMEVPIVSDTGNTVPVRVGRNGGASWYINRTFSDAVIFGAKTVFTFTEVAA
jgi:hypothetical protein